jgi:lipopolysaccharide export system protein LptA
MMRRAAWGVSVAVVLAVTTALIAAQASAQQLKSPPNALQGSTQQAKGAPNALQASTQESKGPPNALQGFSANRDKPVRIQAGSLEVRNKDKVATFSGDVHVTQGDTNLRSKTLVVFYEDDPTKNTMQAAQPGPGGQQRIRRMEARGGVVVTQKDQIATGDTGEFDMQSNTVTLIGNVVVTRAQDVLRGQRLVVDLTNGVSRVDSGRGRVELLIDSKTMHPEGGKAGPGGQGQGQPR